MQTYQEFLKEVTLFVPAKTKRCKYCEQRRTIDKMLFLYTTPNSTRKDKEWWVCCFCNEKLNLKPVV